ncbi:MAG TPA: lytic transglycosylase domain-containing protein [Gemmatimonadales bacterium]|nr:lytic transglycosylase domain-containing protein [Gemmatimonadales bacterium]
MLSVCLSAAALAGSTACGGGAPVAPMAAPEPATAPLDSSPSRRPKVKPRTRPQPPAAYARKPARKPAAVPRDSAALERAVTSEHAHWPLAVALARRSGNPEVAEQAAAALVTEAARLKLSPSLLGAVLLIENTPLNPVAVSSQGALGLMQVMPVHRGNYGCSPDLVNIADNICHGARILKHMVRRTKSVPLALKRYNGCVRGRNTPRCYRYPNRVLRTASHLRREMLLIAADSSIGLEEALASVPRARRSSRPQLVMSEDSVGTELPATMTCASFFGCLRHRWTVKY